MNEPSFVTPEAFLSLELEGPIAIATLCRPPVNAVNDEWVARLNQILDQVEADERIGVLWIRSSSRVFCAGADLEFMRARLFTEEGRMRMIDFTRDMQDVYARLERLGVVSVAEIGGAALGGGFELALACDLRIVADSAKVGLPEARLGLLPAAGGTQRLTRLCGKGVASRLILGAEIIDGTEAVALGLAHWSVPAAQLPAAARALAERIAQLPRAALAASKPCICAAADGGCDGFEAELAGSSKLLAQVETQQRVRRFLENKP